MRDAKFRTPAALATGVHTRSEHSTCHRSFIGSSTQTATRADWRGTKRWSDKFLPDLKAIVGSHLVAETPLEEDQKHNSDLMVLKLDTVRIACRVRSFTDLGKYGGEFTVRSSRPSGTKTELAKIIEGWGDFAIYGFANALDNGLAAWTLYDLNVFRLAYGRELARLDAGRSPGRVLRNRDGSAAFTVFRWADFPAEMIIARAASSKRDDHAAT